MSKYKFILLTLLSIFAFLIIHAACDPDTGNKEPKITSGKPIIIDIQPLGDIPQEYVTYAKEELSKIYPNIEIKKAIPLPKTAYYAPRNRYRADTLIEYLSTLTPAGHVTIGLTRKDISHTKDKIKDYGIMGLGFQPGNACVVSYFRLSKTNTLRQFFKLCIHELGHTQGLPHCPVPTCFMRDAEGKNHTDEEKEFCPKCKKHLENKGWVFN